MFQVRAYELCTLTGNFHDVPTNNEYSLLMVGILKSNEHYVTSTYLVW